MNDSKKFKGNLIVLVGPTASGKTKLAIELANNLNTEIISADSRQFYKELPIGTAAPTIEEQKKAVHHMIGMLSVTDDYNVYKFEEDTINLLNDHFTESKYVILTGGSGLYIDAVCNGIDKLPDIDIEIRKKVVDIFEKHGIEELRLILSKLDKQYYDEVDKANPKRLMRAIEICFQTGEKFSELRTNQIASRSFNIIKVGISISRDELYRRINNRVDFMIDKGWINEAKLMHKFKDLNPLNTVGYKELFNWLDGGYSFEEAVEKIKTNTRRYAKRQMTWFRKNNDITWFDPNDISSITEYITSKSVK